MRSISLPTTQTKFVDEHSIMITFGRFEGRYPIRELFRAESAAGKKLYREVRSVVLSNRSFQYLAVFFSKISLSFI
ncbi:MAG: hypothetical protein WA231_10790 [Methylocella sp.]